MKQLTSSHGAHDTEPRLDVFDVEGIADRVADRPSGDRVRGMAKRANE
jgi:hypothetical protein